MSQTYPIVRKEKPTFYFIGVSTKKSSIMRLFPEWMKLLGRPDIQIEGVDLKIHDLPEAYRQAVAQIKYDPTSLGGLVTTHKIDLLQASRDLFDDLDPYAELCGEVSSISKLDGRLQGHARDPISAGLSMDAILGPSYFSRTGGQVLFLGAGGSAAAALLHLLNKPEPADRPEKVILVDRLPERLDHIRAMAGKVAATSKNTVPVIQVNYLCHEDPHQNDEVMAGLPEYSLVINATGMGKDTPGSPVSEKGVFPLNGVVWEFNYRGELDFLHQARAQQKERQLTIEDGWLYFLHGWTQVIAQVLHLDLTPECFEMLRQEAEKKRS